MDDQTTLNEPVDETTLNEQAVMPVRQQTVDFYGDPITAAQGADETIYVPLRPIVEHLGLDWSSQVKRLRRDAVLTTGIRSVVITTTEGYPRNVLCLPLKLLPGFLFGVQAARVRPELRDKILRYQEDCYEVLWNAFKRITSSYGVEEKAVLYAGTAARLYRLEHTARQP